MCQIVKNFVQIAYLKFPFFNSWRHQKLFLVANQLQDNTFLFEINSEDIGISKLVSQLKLSPSLFELKDNDTIVMTTIINKLQHMSRNRRTLLNKWSMKDYKVTFTFPSHKCSDGTFSALKRIKTYLISIKGTTDYTF